MNQNVKTSGMVHQQEQENVHDKSVKGGNRFPSPEKREADLDQTVEMEEPDGLAERDWQSTEPILGACPDMCAGTIDVNLDLMMFLVILDSRNFGA